LRVKLKRIKTLTKWKKSNEQIKKKKKKTIHYNLGLKGETKNSETFIKDLKKKKYHKNKHQILNIKTW